MTRSIHVIMIAACLSLAACSGGEDLACSGGSGEEMLRCRAELSGDPETQELVELLLSGQAPASDL